MEYGYCTGCGHDLVRTEERPSVVVTCEIGETAECTIEAELSSL